MTKALSQAALKERLKDKSRLISQFRREIRGLRDKLKRRIDAPKKPQPAEREDVGKTPAPAKEAHNAARETPTGGPETVPSFETPVRRGPQTVPSIELLKHAPVSQEQVEFKLSWGGKVKIGPIVPTVMARQTRSRTSALCGLMVHMGPPP